MGSAEDGFAAEVFLMIIIVLEGLHEGREGGVEWGGQCIRR